MCVSVCLHKIFSLLVPVKGHHWSLWTRNSMRASRHVCSWWIIGWILTFTVFEQRLGHPEAEEAAWSRALAPQLHTLPGALPMHQHHVHHRQVIPTEPLHYIKLHQTHNIIQNHVHYCQVIPTEILHYIKSHQTHIIQNHIYHCQVRHITLQPLADVFIQHIYQSIILFLNKY